jgi:hypothetical protein
MTDFLLLEKTASRMCWTIEQRLETEWHSGDSHDRLSWKLDHLGRFKTYVQLRRQFTPEADGE